jgi:3-dehydroquinate synthase
MSVINVKSSLHDYTVVFSEVSDFITDFERYPQRCYAIDHNVWELYSKTLLKDLDSSDVTVVPIDEELKSLDSVQKLYDKLIVRSAKRNLALISIGGGILQDISGFVASTLYRGIKWIFVPTTLLAQADSCIGGKTSLNYKAYKNLIGTFYPPSQVIIHAPFLITQKDLDFYSGLGEVIKLHMIGGTEKIEGITKLLPAIIKREPAPLFQAIQDSLLIKRSYIIDDEFDTGQRIMLNFGHCFGHAIESASDFEIPHGQAVVLGMILANMVAKERGILSDIFHQFLIEKLLIPGLVVKVKREHFDHTKVLEGMAKDKKRSGKGLPLVMMGDKCQMSKVDDLTEHEARLALDGTISLLNLS